MNNSRKEFFPSQLFFENSYNTMQSDIDTHVE